MGPSGNVLFYITPQSINEMLWFKPTQPLLPLTMKHLLDLASRLSFAEVTRISKTFMPPKFFSASPPYHHAWFDETGRLIIDMISYILGFITSEIVDETVMSLISMFSPGQPPAVKYNYATYIATKFMSSSLIWKGREYSSTLHTYHFLLYYQSDSFPVFLKKFDAKGERRSVIFWTSVCHLVSESLHLLWINWPLYLSSHLLIVSRSSSKAHSWNVENLAPLKGIQHWWMVLLRRPHCN